MEDPVFVVEIVTTLVEDTWLHWSPFLDHSYNPERKFREEAEVTDDFPCS